MAKFLIGVVTGFILTGLIAVIVFFAAVKAKNRPPSVEANSVLLLKLEGEVPEKPPVDVPFFSDSHTVTVQNVWSALRKATVDSKIKAVVLEPKGIGVGWAKLQEIRADLMEFKRSGKPVYAYLRTPGTREYYLASAADKIYMAPEDWLNLKGLRFEMMYFKKTLDKIGVTMEIQHAGKYKDFGDMFTRTDMSPETKEVLNSILDDLYGNLATTIAQGRKKSPEEIKALIDKGPFLSQQARESDLVDNVKFEDEMYADLKARFNNQDVKKVSMHRYAGVSGSSLGVEGKQKVAFIVGDGEILRGEGDNSPFGDEGIRSDAFNKLLRQAGNDSSIKGVIVRIDSPGGEVTASDEIWREMMLLRAKKPLVVSMSDTAASGGYYMAMTGDPILAYPGTFTGSIGVVYGKPVLHGLYDKLGITKDMLTRGKYAAIDSDYKPMSTDEKAKLAEGIDASYKEFVTKVSQARKQSYDKIEPLAQGRVWLGSQAKARGLVDELGGLDKAIELIKRKASIPMAERVTLVNYPAKRTFFQMLFNRNENDVLSGKVTEILKSARAQLWLRGGMLRVMPFSLEVK